MTDEKRPIIIKRVKKGGGGHHGGAWKLAYADFVTAMMAFFLLMWLLGSVSEGDKKGIADFFMNPWKPSMSGGSGSGDATRIMPGGGDDLTQKTGQVKMTNSGQRDVKVAASSESEGSHVSNTGKTDAEESGGSTASSEAESDSEEAIAAEEVVQLKKTKEELQSLINRSDLLQQFNQQFRIDITTEGLRVQIVDESKRPMFDIASARMESYATEIIRQIAPVINQLPNHISVTGHTDAHPFGGGGRGYSNWELSADRANAARRALVAGGIQEEKFLRVVGLASSVPMDPKDTMSPVNRRISIIVMKRSAERELVENSGPSLEVGKGAAPPPAGAPTLMVPKPSGPTLAPPSAPRFAPISPIQLPAIPGLSAPTIPPVPTAVKPSIPKIPAAIVPKAPTTAPVVSAPPAPDSKLDTTKPSSKPKNPSRPR